ncbi:rhomboid family intramembrane serine protease [Ideonella azotifigens]|uniref:Peptidase S54 rhomboid domain-containing protein n=2 Tax=Ideonella azotifigens TaxID=513160 RepID=A0ABN1KBY8_9BURK|nr:rhomboid family intramembrane serine protease [Ideonella azotifigens]
MLICTAAYFLDLLIRSFTGFSLNLWMALWPLGNGIFMPWQPFTYALVQQDITALLFNMLGMWMFGGELERLWGQKRYAQFLFAAVIAASVCYLLLSLATGARAPFIGSSPVIYAMLAASAILFPNRTIMPLIPPIPMKQRTYVLAFGAVMLALGLSSLGGIAPFAQLGGALGAWLIIRFWRGQAPFPPRKRR